MKIRNIMRSGAAVTFGAMLMGCASQPTYDYTEFKAANPRSILVLPPSSASPDVNATHAVLAQMTRPLAEAGYYVVPVALMDATFRENGVEEPDDVHDIPFERLRNIFDADAALYTEITEFGTSYKVIVSDTVVAVTGRLVDLRTGTVLWEGRARASSAEQGSYNSGGLAGLLVQAVVEQIISDVADTSFTYAGIAGQRLLSPRPGGLLPGPRSARYGQVE